MTAVELKAHADSMNIPRRTKDDVTAFLAKCKKSGSDRSAAKLLVNHGRLEPDAYNYVRNYLIVTGH